MGRQAPLNETRYSNQICDFSYSGPRLLFRAPRFSFGTIYQNENRGEGCPVGGGGGGWGGERLVSFDAHHVDAVTRRYVVSCCIY